MNPKDAAANAPAQAGESVEQLQRRCAELTAECDRLRQKLDQMKTNYPIVRNSLAFLMRRDVALDDEALLAQSGKGQSLREFLEELKGELKAQGAL